MEAVALHLIGKIGSALGEGAINTVLSLFGEEVSLLAGIQGSLKRFSREFGVMKEFLIQADAQKDKDKTLEVWLEEVRKVAFDVEDNIDEGFYIIGEQHISGFRAWIRRNIHKSRNIHALHNIAAQLKQREADLQQLADIRNRWKINTVWDVNYTDERALHRADSSYLIDDDEIVGIGKEREKLVEWLTDGRLARSIFSVWGMGGLGKTTLVSNVYKSQRIQKHYNNRAWVSVSQTFTTQDLLRRILIEFFGRKQATIHGVDTMDHRTLVETLRNFLSEKNYLVILDDVWSADAWIKVQGALPDKKQIGRIVITTRIMSVALLAPESHVLELQSLQQKEAWDLFCMKAFWKDEDRICPQELKPMAEKIVEKCHGLPLAIVAIGSLLSREEKSELQWRKFHDHPIWELTGNLDQTVLRTLNLSYICLPDYLKNCFLYCSIFPEDYLIEKERLIRLWIAEGIVEGERVKTAELVAEEYLNELIHRCLLQVEEKEFLGRVISCRMHDLVRELTVSMSRTKKFSVLYDDREVLANSCSEVRRISVHRSGDDLRSVTGLQNLRSFIVFDTSTSPSLLMSMISQFKLLRVLDLQDTPIERLPEELTSLFNLHYIGLKNTTVKELPKYIGRLRNLQTLDLFLSDIQKLPRGITELTKLRNLDVAKIQDLTGKVFHDVSGVPAPKGIWNLKGLQVLQFIEASGDLVKQIRNLTQLRKLWIKKVRQVHSIELCKSITRMPFLAELGIMAYDETETILLENLHPAPLHLEVLNLRGRLNKELLESRAFCDIGRNLKVLYMSWSVITENPLPSLSCMANLVVLRLDRAYEGHNMSFCKGWFPKLKTLQLAHMEKLLEVNIEEESMQNLVCLDLIRLEGLMVPRSFEFLLSLRELYLQDMPRTFVDELKRSKFHNIPSITNVFHKEGKWFDESLSVETSI